MSDDLNVAETEIVDADALEQFEGEGLTWTVYRSYQDGEPLPPGNRTGVQGPYVTKITGALSMDGLARVVGPGTWLLYAKRNGKVLKRMRVTIDGVPWPKEAFNRFQPAPLAPAQPAQPAVSAPAWAEPASALTPDLRAEIANIFRNEIRAFAPAFQPAQPAVQPVNQLELINTAMQLAERMNQNTRPGTDLTGLFQTVVEAFQQGMKMRVSAKSGGDGGDGQSVLMELVKAVAPALAQGMRTSAPQGAPARTLPATPMPPVTVSAPAGPLPPNPASLSAVPPAAPQPAPPLGARSWTARDHVFAAIYKAASDGNTEGLGEAVDFYLDDPEFDAFMAIGKAGNFSDEAVRAEVIGWLGESSPMIHEARMAVQAPRFGDLVHQVQNAISDEAPEVLETEPATS